MFIKKHKKIFIIIAIAIVLIIGSIFFIREKFSHHTLSSLTTHSSPNEMIHLTTPQPYDLIKSPLIITGEAKGIWFFEASFPVELRDAHNTIIAHTPAQAIGEWMTELFVPFTATLEFQKQQTNTGMLILRKDNPSGLPEYDNELQIPIVFDNK